MKRSLLIVFATLAFCSTSLLAASFTPVVTYTSSNPLSDNRPFTLGYEFTTSAAFNINALGYYADGAGYSHDVGIWDTSGNLLVSTTVQPSDPAQNQFQWDHVNYLLAPGTYVIGGQSYEEGDSYLFPANANGVATLPGFAWVTDLQLYGSGLNFPTVGNIGYGNNGILTVDFSVATESPIPEPSSLILLATGLLSAAGMIRRRLAS